MSLDSLQARTISYLRLPVGIGVIFIHSLGSHINIQDIDYAALSSVDFYNIFRIIFSKIIPTIASPFFFLISGYFYFRNIAIFNKKAYLLKTKNRVKSILIPYLAWNLLAFIAPIITMVLKGNISLSIEALKGFNPLEIFWVYKKWGYACSHNFFGSEIYLTGPRNIPLWFLRELFVMSLFSPIIYFFVKKIKITGLIILGLCYLTRTWVSIPGFNITAVFFFTLGAFLSTNNKNIIEEVRKIKRSLYLIFLVVFLIDFFTMGQPIQVLFIHQLFKLVGIFTLISFTSTLVDRKRVWLQLDSTIVRSSFVIYVAHSVSILGVVQKIFYHIFQPVSPLLLSIRYLAIIFTTIFICVWVYVLLKKTTPKLLKFITGSR